MSLFQKPNKRLIFTAVTGVVMVVFRKNRFVSRLSQVLFIMSLNQWSKAEYISGANKFRKGLGVAGMAAARLFAAYRKERKQ